MHSFLNSAFSAALREKISRKAAENAEESKGQLALHFAFCFICINEV